MVWVEEQKRPWCCANSAQQPLKHPWISNSFQHRSKTQPHTSDCGWTSSWILSHSHTAFIISIPVKGALGNRECRKIGMQETIFYNGFKSGYLGTGSCRYCSSYTCREGCKLLKISFPVVKNSLLLSSNCLCICKLSIHSHISICIWDYLLSFHEISICIQ